MKWLKENWGWIVLIILVGALAYIIFNGRKGSDYKEQISIMNDSIEVLHNRNQLLEIAVDKSRELYDLSESNILLYQDSLDKERTTITRNRADYEEAILSLFDIPTDTMYLEVTRWLDAR